MRDKNIDTYVKDYEYWLAKYKFIQSKYPGCNVHAAFYPVTFSSKLVNPKYTKFKIAEGYSTLFIEPYLEEEFEHNGKKEKIQVYCMPRRNRLAHIVYPKSTTNPKEKDYKAKQVIRFTKFKDNLAARNISDDCWNECRVAIMNFIKKYPTCTLDNKHMDKSIKKLLAFN